MVIFNSFFDQSAQEVGQPIVNPSLPSMEPTNDASSIVSQSASLPVALFNDAQAQINIDTAVNEQFNPQVAAVGFGSYLQDILPKDVAVAAGAFSATMQQVKNLKNADFERFSQVVYAMETTKGLPSINGTDVPADVPLANTGLELTALGSGPYGTYTMSDFFGCMSGLPYPWKNLYDTILSLQTTKLSNIYDELFLAVTWQGAVIGLTTETRVVEISPGPPPVYQTEYRVATFTVITKGGGYGRGTAPDPIITASNGGAGTGVVGRDNAGAQSNYNGTFGRINSTTVTNQGSWVTSPPTVTSVEFPPIDFLPVQSDGSKATGGTNSPYLTVGWTTIMNRVIYDPPKTYNPSGGYIQQANDEIASIKTINPNKSNTLNNLHDITGLQLTREQRARFIGLPPVPQTKRDIFLNLYPSAQMIFVDAMPELSKNVLPHMSVQTLEAISNYDLIGGQSVVGIMRAERNATRLLAIGVPAENTMPAQLTPEQSLATLVNGVAPETNALPAWVDNGGGQANPDLYFDGTDIYSVTEFSPSNPDIISINTIEDTPVITYTTAGSVPITLDPIPANSNVAVPGTIPGTTTGNFTPTVAPLLPTVGTNVPSGQAKMLDVGKAFPGSLAPSKAISLIPPDLKYASGTTLPSSYTVEEAIEQVIACNCDCWVQ